MDCFKTYDDFKNDVLESIEEDWKYALDIQYMILFRRWDLLEEAFDTYNCWTSSVLVPTIISRMTCSSLPS